MPLAEWASNLVARSIFRPSLTAYDSARQMFYMSLGAPLYIGDDTAGFFLDDFWGFNAVVRMFHERVSAGSFYEIALDPGARADVEQWGPDPQQPLQTQDIEAALYPLPASINPTGVAFDPVKKLGLFQRCREQHGPCL